MHRSFLLAGSIFGLLGVALGAFGAHGLQDLTSDEKILNVFKTGVQYQLYHALALLIVSIFYEKLPGRNIKYAGIFFIIGTLLFSGSLYLLTYVMILHWVVPTLLAILTPLGGLFFLAGWFMLVLAAFKSRSQR